MLWPSSWRKDQQLNGFGENAVHVLRTILIELKTVMEKILRLKKKITIV